MIARQRIQTQLPAREIQRDQKFAQHVRSNQPVLNPDETLIRHADHRIAILHVSNPKPLRDRPIPARQLRVVADSANRRIGHPRQPHALRRRMRQHDAGRARVQHQPHRLAIHQHFQSKRAHVRGAAHKRLQRNFRRLIRTHQRHHLAAVQRLGKLRALPQFLQYFRIANAVRPAAFTNAS